MFQVVPDKRTICPLTTVSGGEVAGWRSHSEARNAIPGLGRTTSPSGEAAVEGANHRPHQTSVGIDLAQGSTILHTLSPPDHILANRQASHHQLGSQRLQVPEPPTGGLVVENPDRGRLCFLLAGPQATQAAQDTGCTTRHDHLALNVCHLDVETGGYSRGERRASFGGFILFPRFAGTVTAPPL
ncbi:hypothetical protein F1880_007047 [Penicillium rolfsii]|nr:hypothetical protein F1880_007047 [Penicillium rolfsii]